MRRRLVNWREFAHRRGWLASPSAAFRGVPFGPQKRDLAGEVMAAIARNHGPHNCWACAEDEAEREAAS